MSRRLCLHLGCQERGACRNLGETESSQIGTAMKRGECKAIVLFFSLYFYSHHSLLLDEYQV